MARVNVYLPDDLARAARTAGLNISKVTQEALSDSLARQQTDGWLDQLERAGHTANVSHERVLAAIDEARAELGD